VSPLSGIAVVLAALGPAALGGGVVAETAAEFDSNAQRIASCTRCPTSPLVRLKLGGHLQQQGGRHRLRLHLDVAGKIFLLPDAQDQNVGVVQLSYEEWAQLGRLRLAGILDYFDAYQQGSPGPYSRDVRVGSTGMRLAGGRPLGSGHSLDGGLDMIGQLFIYKPHTADPGALPPTQTPRVCFSGCYDFVGPAAIGRLVTRLHAGDPELGHDFEINAAGRLDYRLYRSDRQAWFVETGAAATWIGKVLLQLGYTYQLNLATEPGESYQRHLILVKLAARLPGDFYMTAKGQLNLIMSAPELLIPVVSIDEENRSLALLDIEKPLPRGFAVAARYAAYFDLAGGYQRHTASIGLSYRFRVRPKQ
jgi:hypothetical protein